MDRVSLDTDQNPVIKFERINGSLRLKGWDQSSLRTDSEHEDTLSVDKSDAETVINCKSGCIARVPMESNVKIGRVDGELMLKSVDGEVVADEIYGNLLTKSIGPVNLKLAASNVNCRTVEGDFKCETINGNATLQDIDGKITIDRVKGNLVIKGFSSGITANVDGNATLRLETDPQGSYTVTSGGNINCRLSADASAEVNIRSGSKMIIIHSEDGTEVIRESEQTLSFRDGEATIILDAAGNVDFSIQTEAEVDWSAEFEFDHDLSSMANDITQIVTDQLETQLGSLNKNLNHLSSNLSSISPKVTDKIEAKRRKIEQKIAKVERHAAKQGQRASRKSQRSFSTRKPTVDPVSDDERQKVLEMLQNKLITVQEAEMLLATLEGREPDLPGGSATPGND